MSSILILSEEGVRRTLPMHEAIEVMREAFATLSSGKATVPVRNYHPHIGEGVNAAQFSSSAVHALMSLMDGS